jgi:5-methylcytosine-specific restriction endonuclease McrA
MEPLSSFEETDPSLESYWRAIILFGRNVASYKFALGKSLLDLAASDKTFVTLEELAGPFSTYLVEHIKAVDKQGQRPTGPFLEACRQFNLGQIGEEALRGVTTKHGFVNVIDAFHVVNQRAIDTRFFVDERKSHKSGIVLTDNLFALKDSVQFSSLPIEAEARWKLVETAWQLNIGRHLLQVKADESHQLYVVANDRRRKAITSSRDALNGYQKGKCFYCLRDISISGSSGEFADVDHFYPWSLGHDGRLAENLDGIWNLVLACSSCNRGPDGKFSRVPTLRHLDRLERRNNFLIRGHHPLRETLIAQTGMAEKDRTAFLRDMDRQAIERFIHRWQPVSEESPSF